MWLYAATQDNGDDCNNTGLLADVVRKSNMLSLQLYEQEGIGASLLTVANSLLARLYSNSASHTLAEVCGLFMVNVWYKKFFCHL